MASVSECGSGAPLQAGGENVDAFDKVFTDVGGNDQHNAYDADVANSFYNLASDFYEYG